MEEDIDYSSRSTKHNIKDRIKTLIDEAEERQRYESAHNLENLKALAVIKNFIKRKGRVCYGGTAMNAILPPEKQFYSEELDLPDYDFFTPDIDNDIKDLVNDLTVAGFTEVYHKVGIHEGTKKVMVNFMPVADITVLRPELYDVYFKRAVVKGGIHYTDPDMLRSMMYLELSRPKGMVSRWEKVFERLQLINDNFPMKRCAKQKQKQIPAETSRAVYDFVIENQRVLCSAPTAVYEHGIRGSVTMRLARSGPISFASPTAREDSAELKSRIGGAVYLYKAVGEAPERYEIRHSGKTVVTIFADTGCHAYYQVSTDDGRIMLIGSLEFLITLFLTLQIFTKTDTPCVRTLIDLTHKNYLSKTSQFSPLSILCKGYQIGFASLLRKKVNRIKLEEEGVRKTRKKRTPK